MWTQLDLLKLFQKIQIVLKLCHSPEVFQIANIFTGKSLFQTETVEKFTRSLIWKIKEKARKSLETTLALYSNGIYFMVLFVISLYVISAISRGCSKAPAVSRRNGMYSKYNGAVCSQHTVNIMRVRKS